jgi:hypothetical protein
MKMQKQSLLVFVLSPFVFASLAGIAFVAACDSDTKSAPDNGIDTSKLQFDMGGMVSGIDDTHCQGDGGVIKQPVSQAACMPEGGGMPAASNSDGGSDYGPTHYNNIGFDDDCKYLVKWEATPIHVNQDVYFEMTATATADGTAVVAQTRNGIVQGPTIESFLDDMHPADTNRQRVTQTIPGTYVMGPIRFDTAGIWTVRFHINGDCYDFTPDSPHGHAAFFVAVPADQHD